MTYRTGNLLVLLVIVMFVIMLAIWMTGCSLLSLKPQLLSPPGASPVPTGSGGALGEDNVIVQIVGSLGTVVSLIVYRTLWYRKKK